ncbi:hypothetical protein Zmor_001109 [Zophobas morio]|uniref:Uncharacterized protein n=1 Tax=Zophobas morio TaxID=2755281 RepID=A0AA38J0G1_9CUCU|nr:hypothetical protein Zmor_001109 [Zophobas morio]
MRFAIRCGIAGRLNGRPETFLVVQGCAFDLLAILNIRYKLTKVALDMFGEFHPVRGGDYVGRGIVGFLPDAHDYAPLRPPPGRDCQEVVGVELVDDGDVHFVLDVLDEGNVQNITWCIWSGSVLERQLLGGDDVYFCVVLEEGSQSPSVRVSCLAFTVFRLCA